MIPLTVEEIPRYRAPVRSKFLYCPRYLFDDIGDGKREVVLATNSKKS